MLEVSSGLDGYPSNWARACDTCHAAACTLYCHTDSAYLCQNCDECIHGADSTASQHERVWVCTVCENAPAAFTCQADAASLCISCDIEIHSANPLARRHNRVPIPRISGIGYATSTSYGGQLQGPLLVTENKSNEEVEEDETDSWLLLDLDHTDNQTNSGFTYAEEAPEYLDLAEYNSSTEYQCEDKNDQQEYSNICQEDNNSDNVVPVQHFEAKEQQQKQQQNEPAKQPRQQQQQKNTFDMEYEASKTAFINASSNSQRVRFHINSLSPDNGFLFFCSLIPEAFYL